MARPKHGRVGRSRLWSYTRALDGLTRTKGGYLRREGVGSGDVVVSGLGGGLTRSELERVGEGLESVDFDDGDEDGTAKSTDGAMEASCADCRLGQ
jgi:hypothetical protein